MCQLQFRNIRFCPRRINEWISLLGPLFRNRTHCVSFLLISRLYSYTTSFSGLKITTEISGEDVTYWEDSELATQDIDVNVTLQHSTLVIAYCLIITFTFCSSTLTQMYCPYWRSVYIGLVTLVICLIMIATVVFGFRQRNEIVVVPIGTVFAFTQLRFSMPGVPDGFGMPLFRSTWR